MRKIKRPAVPDHAHSRETIDDEATALVAGQIVRPLVWFVAVHLFEKIDVGVASQLFFEFRGVPEGIVYSPLRRHARVHHQCIYVGAMMCERSKSQPVNQLAAIFFREDFLQRLIVSSRLSNVVGQCDEVQIMIAENRNRRIAEASYKAQCLA